MDDQSDFIYTFSPVERNRSSKLASTAQRLQCGRRLLGFAQTFSGWDTSVDSRIFHGHYYRTHCSALVLHKKQFEEVPYRITLTDKSSQRKRRQYAVYRILRDGQYQCLPHFWIISRDLAWELHSFFWPILSVYPVSFPIIQIQEKMGKRVRRSLLFLLC